MTVPGGTVQVVDAVCGNVVHTRLKAVEDDAVEIDAGQGLHPPLRRRNQADRVKILPDSAAEGLRKFLEITPCRCRVIGS